MQCLQRFMTSEPLTGKRWMTVSQCKTKLDWAYFIKEIAKHYEEAKKVTLVMGSLNTHKAGSLYEALTAEEAKRVRNRFDLSTCLSIAVGLTWLRLN